MVSTITHEAFILTKAFSFAMNLLLKSIFSGIYGYDIVEVMEWQRQS